MPEQPSIPSEKTIVFLVGAIQFVNVLDFMMVMPLGPDFAVGLGIPAAHLGYIGGSYTAAAAVSGLAGSLFLDRFDRRSALGLAMLGLVIGTLAGGFAQSFETLIAARIVAGLFGGPATSLSLSIIADIIPPERRGRALGAVMSAFSVASVVGVPAGLELARHGGWRLPFFAVAGVGLVVTATAIFLLPSLRLHLDRAKEEVALPFFEIFSRPIVLYSLALTASSMIASFVLVPNLSAYLQYNLGYPRGSLWMLYAVGGSCAFFANRLYGRLVDRYGSFRIGSLGTLSFITVVYFAFLAYSPSIPVLAIFVAFMLSTSLRAVPLNTLTTKVPSPRERARFMSIQSAVQHFSGAVGAFLSAKLLHEQSNHRLEGITSIAGVSIAAALLFPVLAWTIESRVRARASEASAVVVIDSESDNKRENEDVPSA
jgi:predicted MFS family arabinose efflux permease